MVPARSLRLAASVVCLIGLGVSSPLRAAGVGQELGARSAGFTVADASGEELPLPRVEACFVPAPLPHEPGAHAGAVLLGAGSPSRGAWAVRRGELGAGAELLELALDYRWYAEDATGTGARLELGIRTAEHARVPRSGRAGEPSWDKLLVLEPAREGRRARGAWQREEANHARGRFWILDRVERVDTRATPTTLAAMAGSAEPVGSRTLAELFALLIAPDAVVTELRIGPGAAAGAQVYVSELSAAPFFGGATVTFGAAVGVTNLDTAEVFASIQAAIDDPDTLDGHTLSVMPGTYPESLVLGKRLNLLGAQAGTTAVGRITGAPSSATESIVAPPAGPGLTLVTGCADSTIDGFTFLGGSLGVDSASGPLDALQVLGNHFEGQTLGNAVLDAFAVNMTVDGNVFLSTAAMGISVELGMGDCDGLHFTGNRLSRTGGTSSSGLRANGNNNLGASGLRPPLISGNVVEGHGVGLNLGARAFLLGDILQNELRYNGTGLGFGIQDSLVANNLIIGNQIGLDLSSLGSASPLSGAFGNVVSGNQVLGNGVAGVRLSAGQAPGSIGTNGFDSNCFGGNAVALDYAGGETILAEGNWWGHASGPADPVGTNPADNLACPPVPLVNAGGLGDPVTGSALDYCPWLEDAVCQSLALLAADCQDDAFPGQPGLQVAVELWMLDLASPATGFQAFLTYDDAALSYRGDLSTYTLAPFPLHIQAPLTAEVLPGELRLDGSDVLGGGGSSSDALLATLVFDVSLECSVTSVGFDLTQPFESTISYVGFPLPTKLTDSPGFTLDDTAPVFDPYADITVAADASSTGGCGGAVVSYATPTFVENCAGPVTLDCVPPSGSFFPAGATTTVTCTATDACGNGSVLTFDVTVTATNLIDVELDLVGVAPAVSRCVRFQLDDCTVVDATLAFAAGPPAKAIATIEVPCGDYATLCAKDEQHTLWGSSPLVLSLDGTRYETSGSIQLDGGDTDGDGDVDIDDVTWFLAQFGSFAAAGGCPWDGTRDADFSNNTVVASEDYTFLVTNWLTLTSCAGCPAPAAGAPRSWTPAADPLTRAADLNRDGRVDHLDVERFEDAAGLPRALSTRMRASAR